MSINALVMLKKENILFGVANQ